MGDLTLTSAVRQNLLSLQSTADMLTATQAKLATGKKVNSALDNPSNFFTAAGLDNRASDISKLMDGIGGGIQTLKAADTGIKGLSKLVDSAKAVARQALQAPNAYTAKASVTSSASGLTADNLLSTISGTGVNAATGTGITAIDTTSFPDKVAGFQLSTIVADTAATTTGSAVAGAGGSSSTALNALTTAFAAGDALTITGANGTKTLNVTTAATGTSDNNNIRADDTIANLSTKMTALLKEATGDNSAAVSFDTSTNKFTVQMNDNAKDFTIGGNVSKLGLTAGTYTPTNGSLQGKLAAVSGSTVGSSGTLTGSVALNDGTDGLSTVPTAGDKFTIAGEAGTKTVKFIAAGGTTGLNATTGEYDIALDSTMNASMTAMQTAFRAATGDTSATVDFNTTATGKVSFKMSDTSKGGFTLANTSGTSLASFGLSTGGTYTAASSSAIDNPTAAKNLVSSGYSMSVSVGSNSAKTMYFGTGTGQIQNRRDLVAQLNTVSGLSVNLDSTTNKLTLKNADATDFKSDLTISGSNTNVLSDLGIATAASPTTTNGKTTLNGTSTSATINATNLLTQDQTNLSSLSGKSLTLSVGSNQKTFTFGTAKDQISTFSELQSAISGMGATLTKDAGNKLSITTDANNIAKPLTVSGNGASTLGINSGTFSGSGKSLDGTALTLVMGSGASQKSSSITFGTGAGQVSTLDQLNAKLITDGVGVQASVTDGKLSFTTNNENAKSSFSMSGTAASRGFGASSAFDNVKSSDPSFGGTGDATRRNLVKDFNDLLGQIDKLADDSSFNGVNLLKGDDMNIIFNEKNTSSVKVKGVDFSSGGLGLTSLKDDGSDFLDSTSINGVLSKLDTASNTMRSQSSKFGANLSVVQTRQDFSKELISVLQTGSANLTLADMNEEAANSTALQTRQQLSVAAMSVANQANQSVLQLIR